MELATAVIWTLRILLPIILFCIYFKLQSPKDDHYPGPTNNVHSRDKMLAHRKATVHAEVPPQMENITLKDSIEAPQLFAGGRGSRPGRRSGDATRERRGDRRTPEARQTKLETPAVEVGEEPDATVDSAAAAAPDETKMHLESLLNYVAFNRKEQQRTFLPDEAGGPPPPPPPPAKKKAEATDAESEKANADAQLVLKGAIDFKRSDVAKNVYQQLQEAQMSLLEPTYALLIEACVAANDLKGSSDYLMKMENAGFLPHSELLDKVMNLYSQQKSQRALEKQEAENLLAVETPLHQAGPEDMIPSPDAEGPRTMLSATASVFVPSFIPPPPAQPLGESVAEDVVEPWQDMAIPRTRLVASAKPFEPKFCVPFDDPSSYPWTAPMEQFEDEGTYVEWGDAEWNGEYAEWNRGKVKERGKGKGKGRGEAKKEWSDEAHQNWEAASWKEHSKRDASPSRKDGKKEVVMKWKPKAEGGGANTQSAAS